jgi:integrase
LPLHEERWAAAGKLSSVGWHTFRHTYRSWLDDTGAPVGMQQKLMRHAQVFTTMNDYGNALKGAEREANSRVVQMALRSA